MAKTPIDDEVEKRVEYFENWLEEHSEEQDRDKVVNEKTAREFVRDIYMKDHSLRNLIGGMDDQPASYKVLIQGKYIQKLINLNKPLIKLRKAEIALTKALPPKKVKTRRKVINAVMKQRVSQKYGIKRVEQKNGVISYRDAKGQFVATERLLSISDKIIASSAKKRLELEQMLKKDAFGRDK